MSNLTNKLMKRTHLLMMLAALMVLTTNAFAQGPNNSGTYYAAANGKKGAELKTALCGIIRPGLEDNKVGYKGLWAAYPSTDARPDDATKVWDMYSSTSDFTFGDDQDKGSGGNVEGQFYNREHSFPQEWFGGCEPIKSDLFHVYPTDKMVNGKRSNHPYGETDGPGQSAEGFSKWGNCKLEGYSGTVFEPNDIYKGDFARSYFYMVTCYEEDIVNPTLSGNDWSGAKAHTIDGKRYPGFQQWQLDMLMRWAETDPIDQPVAKETPRNNAVAVLQKNRNPFIDYPGLERYIWGDYTDVAFSYDNYQIPTEIMTVKEERRADDNVMYNMAGQVVDKSYKGIVIMNGRKFVNK